MQTCTYKFTYPSESKKKFQFYLDDPNPPNFDGGMSAAGYSNHGWYHEGIVKDPLGIDITDSMVTNPVYGEHMPSRVMGPTGNVGVVSDDRPVSPLEHTLVANPLYGEHRNMNPLQLGRAGMEGGSKSTSDTDGREAVSQALSSFSRPNLSKELVSRYS